MSGGGGEGLSQMVMKAAAMIAAAIAVIVDVLMIAAVMILAIILQPLLGVIGDWVDGVMNGIILPLTKWFIAANPNVFVYTSLVNDIIRILSTAYIIAIILTGLYIIFVSSSVENRARAKSILLRLIFGLVLTGVSLQIYDMFMRIGSALTERILASVVVDGGGYFAAGAIVALSVYEITFVPIVAILALLAIAARYFLASIMAILFPITLFLYFFDLTRGIGTNMLRFTLMVIFSQPVMAIMLFITISALNSVGETEGNFIASLVNMTIAIAGFVMIAATPLIMMGIMQWLGGAVASYGMMLSYSDSMTGGMLVGLGGLAAGMGPESFIVGYSARALGHHKEVLNDTAKRSSDLYGRARAAGVDLTPYQAHCLSEKLDHELGDIELKGRSPGITGGIFGDRAETDALVAQRAEAILKEELGAENAAKIGGEWALTPGRLSARATRSMLPYPLQRISEKGMFYRLKETVRRPGTSFRRLEHWNHVRKLKGAGSVNDVAAITEEALSGKVNKTRLDEILLNIRSQTDIEKARSIGNATMTYSFLERDLGRSPAAARYGRVLDAVGTQLEGGKADALKMDNVVRTMKDVGEAEAARLTGIGDAAGAARVRAETDGMVNNYVKDHKYFHNIHGDENKAEFFAIVNGNRRVTADWIKDVSPAERKWLDETYGGISNCEYSLDLGSNLHARMMLEDYMGIGPRPSEFYHGLGPDTREGWEAERARLAEGDKDSWESV